RGAPRDVGRVADAARGRLPRHMVRENEHPDAVAMVTLPVVGVLVRRRPEMTARVAFISAGLVHAGRDQATSERDWLRHNPADEVNGEGESSTAQLFGRCGCDDE
ncbi:MAG: hypothetical protein QOK30_3262, partial [Nocardioidaceae bacterium]|nr:hypothetical protein [Nocardioidaceae bacterium]